MIDNEGTLPMAAAGGHTAKREAREFLLERLEAGPAKRDTVVEEAKEEGIAFATLKRAKKELGVRSYKERGKIDGDWFWELPTRSKGPPEREKVSHFEHLP